MSESSAVAPPMVPSEENEVEEVPQSDTVSVPGSVEPDSDESALPEGEHFETLVPETVSGEPEPQGLEALVDESLETEPTPSSSQTALVRCPKTELKRQHSYLAMSGTTDEFGVNIQVDLYHKYSHVGDRMRNLLKNLAVRQDNYLGMVIALMEIVEENDELAGSDKADLVTYFTGKMAQEFGMFENHEQIILFLRTLPNLYEVVTKITKGELCLNPTKEEVKRVKKEVNVITYSVYEEVQRFIDEHNLKPEMVVVTAPQVIYVITEAVECYTFLRSFEKDLFVNQVIDLFIENSAKIFPTASEEVLHRLAFTYQRMRPLPRSLRAVQRKEFYINTKADTVNLNRAPVQIHHRGCLPLFCR